MLSSGYDMTVAIMNPAVVICPRPEERQERGLLDKKKGVGLSGRGMREGCGVNVITMHYTQV